MKKNQSNLTSKGSSKIITFDVAKNIEATKILISPERKFSEKLFSRDVIGEKASDIKLIKLDEIESKNLNV